MTNLRNRIKKLNNKFGEFNPLLTMTDEELTTRINEILKPVGVKYPDDISLHDLIRQLKEEGIS